jgi:hypothetical protein
MKQITIKFNDNEYLLLKDVIASEFTNLETDTDAVLWSIALAKLCLEEAKKFTDVKKKKEHSSFDRNDGIPGVPKPSSIENIYDLKLIPPVPAPSPAVNPPLDYLVQEVLGKTMNENGGVIFNPDL